MASCSLATLQAQACANGFLALDDKQADALILQLWANLSGNNLALDQLQAQACANHFKSLDSLGLDTVQLQMLCNMTEGLRTVSDCVNVIPAGSDYGQFGLFNLALTAGQTYQLTWGINEDSAVINGVQINNPGVGEINTFISDGEIFTLLAAVPIPNQVITATLCEVQS
jgi:hypothetical protein